MTLDLEKFISNSIAMQAKIQHFDMSTKTVKDPPASVKDIILKEYGEKYLDDADYVSFFWGRISKDDIDKLFNVVDKALGKSANKLTNTDFKKITVGDDAEADDEQPVEEHSEDNNVDNNAEDTEVEVEDTDEQPNEDAEDENDSFDEPQKPVSHFFLKITLK